MIFSSEEVFLARYLYAGKIKNTSDLCRSGCVRGRCI